jgi:hypothetical protein
MKNKRPKITSSLKPKNMKNKSTFLRGLSMAFGIFTVMGIAILALMLIIRVITGV